MRYLILCSANDEPGVVAAAVQNTIPSSDRVIILSPRRGSPWRRGSILNIPLIWVLNDVALRAWQHKNRIKQAISVAAGLRTARLFGGIKDLLMNIDASDPDVIDLTRLGAFGRWLQPKCSLRFPGRTVLTSSAPLLTEETVSAWRTYNRTALVSIVLPVHNGAKYLRHSIDSCLSQAHKNIQLIIVDDGSQDDTPAIIREYAALDHRVIYITNEQNLGLPESLNAGFRLAEGEFLTWTSDDNLYAPHAIEYMVQQLCTFPKLGLVYCSTHQIDESGDMRAGVSACQHEFNAAFPPTALLRWTAVTACFLYRREVMEVVGPYRPECRHFEDWDFFTRACIRFPAKFYFEPCYFYRKHAGSLTSAHSQKWSHWYQSIHDEHFSSRGTRIMVPTTDQLIPKLRTRAL